MQEIELSGDLTQVTAEIKSYQSLAGQSIYEIGRRLNWVKQHDLAHGQWGDWLSSVGMNQSTANKFMKIAVEFPNSESVPNLGWAALYEIATMPTDAREMPQLTSSGHLKTPDEMTVAELKETKARLKAQEQQVTNLFAENSRLKSQPPKQVEVEVAPADYEQLKRERAEMGDDLAALKRRNEHLEEEMGELQKAAGKYEADSAEYEQLKSQIDELRGKKSQLDRKVSAAAHLIDLKGRVDDLINELAPELYAVDFAEFRPDDPAMVTLGHTIDRVARWVKDIRAAQPDGSIIEGEVNES